MSDRQRKGRDERLVDKAYKSEGLSAFFHNDDVQKFFRDRESECVDMIASADPNDDDARRSAGLQLQALRNLRDQMQSIIAAGHSAAKRLQELQQ